MFNFHFYPKIKVKTQFYQLKFVEVNIKLSFDLNFKITLYLCSDLNMVLNYQICALFSFNLLIRIISLIYKQRNNMFRKIELRPY